MIDYEVYKTYQEKYQAWSIQDVNDFFIYELGALSIPLEHPDLQYYMTDPYIPKREKICGVYGIYKKSILALLQGEVENVQGIDFALKKKQDVILGLDDVETILFIGPLVVLETEDHKRVSGCFIGGDADRIYHLIKFFSGLPPISQTEFDAISFRKFIAAVENVKRMGFL